MSWQDDIGDIAKSMRIIAEEHTKQTNLMTKYYEAFLTEFKTSNTHLKVIAEQVTAHTPLFERFAESNEQQARCCANGSERAEALIEVSMKDYKSTADKRYDTYSNWIGKGK